jgi:hypothetical protein
MATSNKSTKAKTKTPKKSVAARKSTATKKPAPKKATNAAKASAAATKSKSIKATKSTKSKAATKANTKKPVVKKAKLTDIQLLSRLNALSAVVHLVGAVLVALLMGTYVQQVFANYVARDELASGSETVFVPAIHHLYDVQLKWIVVAILVAGAIVPLIQLRRRTRYEQQVKARANALRWADKAIVSGTMLTVVAAVSGVQDFMTLKVVGGLIVVTAMLGWLSERQNHDSKARPDYSAFGISLVTGALPWLIILGLAFATPVWGAIRYSWFVYALYAAVFVGSAAYAINGYNYVRRFRNWTNYVVVERNFIIIDIVTRLAFAGILIVGLAK